MLLFLGSFLQQRLAQLLISSLQSYVNIWNYIMEVYQPVDEHQFSKVSQLIGQFLTHMIARRI
jgi:hypothetical protein